MSGLQMIREEEVQLGGDETRGSVLMTAGKLLLWTDLIFMAFIYSGIKGGSYLCLLVSDSGLDRTDAADSRPH